MKNNVRTPRMFRGEKRILSFLLILAMVFAVIPNSVVRVEDEITKGSRFIFRQTFRKRIS